MNLLGLQSYNKNFWLINAGILLGVLACLFLTFVKNGALEIDWFLRTFIFSIKLLATILSFLVINEIAVKLVYYKKVSLSIYLIVLCDIVAFLHAAFFSESNLFNPIGLICATFSIFLLFIFIYHMFKIEHPVLKPSFANIGFAQLISFLGRVILPFMVSIISLEEIVVYSDLFSILPFIAVMLLVNNTKKMISGDNESWEDSIDI